MRPPLPLHANVGFKSFKLSAEIRHNLAIGMMTVAMLIIAVLDAPFDPLTSSSMRAHIGAQLPPPMHGRFNPIRRGPDKYWARAGSVSARLNQSTIKR